MPAPRLRLLGLRALVWLFVVAGAVGGVAGLLRSPAAPTEAINDASLSVDPAVAGVGELAVRRWLRASETEEQDGLFLTRPDSRAAGEVAPVVEFTAAVSVRTLERDYWAVTVAADVTESPPGGAGQSATWFFEVGIARGADQRLTAVTAPALVPPPVGSDGSRRIAGRPLGTPRPDDPVAAAVEGFLSGLLTGRGDSSRFLAPGFALAPLIPAPLIDVGIDRLAINDQPDGTARARAAVTGTSPNGAVYHLVYELQLAQRAGRWEVQAISGAPALAETHPPTSGRQTTPAPTATPQPATGPGA